MSGTRAVSFSVVGLFLVLGMAACGGSSAVTGTDEGPPASAASGHAVVQGSVVGSSEGMRVSVANTSASTLVDDDGQFVLAGLPAGTVTLKFQGGSVDARLDVSGVQEHQVTSVNVTVSGSEARLNVTPTCAPSAETFLSGVIERITGTQFVIAGHAVDLSTVNKIWRGSRRLTIDDLKVGDKVKVWGTLRADAVLVADEITLLAGEPGADGTSWYAFNGVIQSITFSVRALNPSCTYTYPAFVASGITVYTGEATAFAYADGTAYDPSILAVGRKVYVEGWKKPDGSVRATLVRP